MEGKVSRTGAGRRLLYAGLPLPLRSRSSHTVEDRTPPTARANEPLPLSGVAEAERAATNIALRHGGVAARTARRLLPCHRITNDRELGIRVLGAFG